ncbi:MAG: hypothetical protein KC466_08010, partial [Myxococcales bacterium]|nr:hypothetical protein [Myxococcales bacterium]
GVVSLPHGWGHGRAGTRQGVAARHAGVSLNELTDERLVDKATGATNFAVPVEVVPIEAV